MSWNQPGKDIADRAPTASPPWGGVRPTLHEERRLKPGINSGPDPAYDGGLAMPVHPSKLETAMTRHAFRDLARHLGATVWLLALLLISAQAPPASAKGAAPPPKKGAAPAGTAAAPAATAAPADTTAAAADKDKVRTVGPTFIPPKQ